MGPKISGNYMAEKPIVLTIDDDPEFNRLIALHLKKQPIELHTTETPEEFLKLYTDLNPKLCLVDLNIGKYRELGFQLIAAIRNKGKKTPIVVISRIQAEEKIAQAMDVGADDYIPKPIDPLTLQSKLKRFLNLAKEDDTNVRMGVVPKFDRACHVSLDLKISKISEDGLYMRSNSYLAKSTPVFLQGEFFMNMINTDHIKIMTVTSSRLLPDGGYETFLEFDADEVEIQNAVRLWISKNAAD